LRFAAAAAADSAFIPPRSQPMVCNPASTPETLSPRVAAMGFAREHDSAGHVCDRHGDLSRPKGADGLFGVFGFECGRPVDARHLQAEQQGKISITEGGDSS